MRSVLIGVPSWEGTVPMRVMSRLTHLQVPEETRLHFTYSRRTFIDLARNGMLEQALLGKHDYLFFCDTDQICDQDILVKLIKCDKDIAAPPIPNRMGKKELAVFDKDMNKMESIKKTQRVGGVGMGSTLIKKKVLEEMRKRYDKPFEFETIREQREKGPVDVTYSEDINFCRRAGLLGFESWCCCECKSLHVGPEIAYYYEGGEYKNQLMMV